MPEILIYTKVSEMPKDIGFWKWIWCRCKNFSVLKTIAVITVEPAVEHFSVSKAWK